ncbi:MAG: hypothetical protein ACM3SW_10960 [Actinomycetota bacterium]
MEHTRRNELEVRLRDALREHQHEGLHLIGGTDQLIARLLNAVEDWERGTLLRAEKSA